MSFSMPTANIDFEIYDDSGTRLLGVANVDLPELAFKTQTISGAGVAGSIDLPVRGFFENLTVTVHFRTLTEEATQFLNQNSAQTLTLREAVEEYDTGTGARGVKGWKIVMRGYTSKLALGKVEPGEPGEVELELTLDYLKIGRGANTVFEFDRFNYVFNGGFGDMLSGVRGALGI